MLVKVCFTQCFCVLVLHTKWNIMLEVLLVSWRVIHSIPKCLFQVHRGLRDLHRLSSPAHSRSALGCIVCLFCLFISGEDDDYDGDFRGCLKPETVSPHLQVLNILLLLHHIQNFTAKILKTGKTSPSLRKRWRGVNHGPPILSMCWCLVITAMIWWFDEGNHW